MKMTSVGCRLISNNRLSARLHRTITQYRIKKSLFYLLLEQEKKISLIISFDITIFSKQLDKTNLTIFFVRYNLKLLSMRGKFCKLFNVRTYYCCRLQQVCCAFADSQRLKYLLVLAALLGPRRSSSSRNGSNSWPINAFEAKDLYDVHTTLALSSLFQKFSAAVYCRRSLFRFINTTSETRAVT